MNFFYFFFAADSFLAILACVVTIFTILFASSDLNVELSITKQTPGSPKSRQAGWAQWFILKLLK